MSARLRFMALFITWLGITGPALAGMPFAAHLAVYDIKLKHAEASSGVADVSGRMVMELTGSECAGWSVGFRMVNQFADPEGDAPRLVDIQSTSWESADGLQMQFAQTERVNNQVDSDLRLSAELGNDGLRVKLASEGNVKDLPRGVIFPMAHQRRLLNAAISGAHMDRSAVYDGSEGLKYYKAVTVIGPEIGPDAQAPAGLATLKSWPMLISYFETDSPQEGEMLPAHQISMRLFENGVASDLVMDYGDLQLSGQLSELQLHGADGDDCH